jgi:inner membrane protein involved in colicin E2 resistance
MKIVPTSIEQQINRVDRTRSLAIGVSCGLLALWSVYRVIWSLYLALTYNFLFGSMVFQIVLWGVIGAVAAIAATGFLTRYSKATTADGNEGNKNQP